MPEPRRAAKRDVQNPVFYKSGVVRTIRLKAYTLIDSEFKLALNSFGTPLIRWTKKEAGRAKRRGEKIVPVRVSIRVED